MKYIGILFCLVGGLAFCQVNLTSSNLPIVKITIPPGQQINDLTRIVCDMGVIDNSSGLNLITDPFNNYSGKIAIEIRGSTSQQYPKKSYGFETQTLLGTNNNVSLMGLPIENDWILNGPYPDKTLLRDALTYNLSNSIISFINPTPNGAFPEPGGLGINIGLPNATQVTANVGIIGTFTIVGEIVCTTSTNQTFSYSL
jgi:hypothetical protein